MPSFKISSKFKPTGDQPQAIEKLVKGLNKGESNQVLLGVTGSGKSVVRKTPILVKNAEGIKMENIGELVDRIFNEHKNKIRYANETEIIFTGDLPKKCHFQTYSFDPLSKLPSWKNIVQFTRHKSPEFLYNVQTSCGREVTVTGDHNFYILRNGSLCLVKTNEMQERDYMPVPLILEHSNAPLYNFSLMDYLGPSKSYLSIPNFSEIWLKSQREIRNYLSPAKIHNILHQNERLSSIMYDQLKGKIPGVSIGATIGSKARDYQFPLIQSITPDLLRFLGYYIAEGHSTGGYFLISSADREIIDDFTSTVSSLGLNYAHRPDSYDYQISSSFWAQLLINLCGKDSRTKHLPDFWLQLSNIQLASLLKAYFSADGGVNGDEITFASASSQLSSEIMYALLRFGIVARGRRRLIKIPNSNRRGTYWEVRISGQKFLTIFKQRIGFSLTRKNNSLINIIKETYNTNVDVIPIDGAWIKKIRTELNLYQRDIAKPLKIARSLISLIEDDLRKPSREVFRKIIHLLKDKSNKQGNLEVLQQIQDKEELLNLYWSPVKKVDKIKREEYVYDLAVQDNETFLAGFGGMFVHNTFSMANVIEKVQRPTLIISHNKTLAGQLAQEFKSLFPQNAVEYFVSYYDYYQPEAYIPSSDTYIEKETQINEEIEKLRLSATTSLMTRRDVIVVASVSCIYNLGNPVEYQGAILEIKNGVKVGFESIMKMLTKMFYSRNDIDFKRSTYRVKGDTIDIFPSYSDQAVRIELLGDKIERISHLNPLTGDVIPTDKTLTIYPAKHYITPEKKLLPAIAQIESDLRFRIQELKKLGKLLEAQRLEQRTNYDLEMIREFGYCNGIENYSRYFEEREAGDPPYTLMEYFAKDFLVIIDESHISLPQIRGMYNGDQARKRTLIEFGFRLPSALDNRPLKFDEFQRKINQVIYVSATPDEYELSLAGECGVAEQLIRPTGIIEPVISVRQSKGQIQDVLEEVKKRVAKHERVLITTLTKRMAEDLSDFLLEKGIKVNYLHSDIETLKRADILQSLRLGEFDVLVGINLLREGLDLPEVSLVVILDADKEGFLRSKTSLVQTMGRAARHMGGEVIMYADVITKSMKAAIDEVERRRKYQLEYNIKHKITPKSIEKALRERLIEKVEELDKKAGIELTIDQIPQSEKAKMIKLMEAQMKQAAELLDFEEAAKLRDQIKELNI